MGSENILLSRINREYSILTLVREVLLCLGIYLFYLSFPTAFDSIQYPFYFLMILIIASILVYLPVYIIISGLKKTFKENKNRIIKIDKHYQFLNNLVMAILIPAVGGNFINIFWFVTAINACSIFTAPFSGSKRRYFIYFAPLISLLVHYSIYFPQGKPFQPIEGGFALLMTGVIYYTHVSFSQKQTFDKLVNRGNEAISIFCQKNGLTEREEEILANIFEGKSTKRIAADLYISPGTVRNHISSIFEKTDTHSRMELVSEFNRS